MPSRSGFDAVLVNSSGVPMSNISITVLKSDGTQATVYQSKTGTSIKAQPIVTDSSNAGLIQFWADPGYYQVRATDLNVPARIATRFIPFDAVAGDMNGGIDSDQITLTNEITSSMIQNDAITTAKIGNSQITTAKIADNNITTSKLVDGLVTESKIGSGAITSSKLGSNTISFSNLTSPTTSTASGSTAGSASGTITARKYVTGQVELTGGITFSSWPGYFSPVNVDGRDYTMVNLGTLSAGFRPVASFTTTGNARFSSALIFSTIVVVLNDGGIYARANDPYSTANPLTFDVGGLTFYAG